VLQAQVSSCSDLSLGIVATAPLSGYNCSEGGTSDCFRMGYFGFFSGSLPAGTTFSVTNLVITGSISGGTIDESISSSCTPALDLSISGSDFTYSYFSDPGMPLNVAVLNNPDANNTQILFYLIVEARVGAEVSLVINSISFDLVENAAITEHCEDIQVFIPSPVNMPAPSACNNGMQLKLDDWDLIYQAGTPPHTKVPVSIRYDYANVPAETYARELDFALTVTDVAGTLESVEIKEGEDLSGVVWELEVESVGNVCHLYFHYWPDPAMGNTSFVFEDGDELGRFTLHYTTVTNAEIETEVEFDFARLRYEDGGVFCCQPGFASNQGSFPYVVSEAGDPVCAQDLRLEVVRSTAQGFAAPSPDGNCGLDYRVRVYNDGNADLSLHDLSFKLSFSESMIEIGAIENYSQALCPCGSCFLYRRAGLS